MYLAEHLNTIAILAALNNVLCQTSLQKSWVYNVHFFGWTDHRFIESRISTFSSEKAKWANCARTVRKFQSTRFSPSSTGFYQFLMTSKYSENNRIPVTRTLRGNEKQFELARVRVIGVDWKIQYAMLEIDVYWFLNTSLYGFEIKRQIGYQWDNSLIFF